AGFRVLQVLHQQNKGSLPVAVRAFTEKLRQKDSNNKFIDLANLLLAEWYFSQAEKLTSIQDYTRAKDMYRGASTAYNSVRESNIDPKHHAPRLYKLGWSLLEIGNVRSGVQVVSQFISKNPDSPLTSSAIAKRAATYQNLQDHDFALKDYQSIIKDYPKAPEVELAMQQVALIYGHKKDIPKMIEAYKALLAKFPNTSGSDEAYYWIGVGLFDQKKYAESIDPLNKAREMAPTKYRDSAGIRIILSHYQLEKIDPLATEAKRYIQAGKGILGGDKDKARPQLSPIVLQYLGQKLMDKKDYGQAEYFLNELSTPEAPEKTPIEVWKALADCRQELKMHEGVIAAYDHYLLQTERPSERALAYKNRGISQLALKRFSPAKESARECLKNQKEGRINAEGRLLLGDVYAAEGDLDSAVREYLIVSQVFDDREITPQAFSKAIKAYESLGKSTEVKDLQEQLRSRFPDYRE
ncbi:MAG: tetratricopeptide repeat protein, partial [Verrucomicrobiota bacterium]